MNRFSLVCGALSWRVPARVWIWSPQIPQGVHTYTRSGGSPGVFSLQFSASRFPGISSEGTGELLGLPRPGSTGPCKYTGGRRHGWVGAGLEVDTGFSLNLSNPSLAHTILYIRCISLPLTRSSFCRLLPHQLLSLLGLAEMLCDSRCLVTGATTAAQVTGLCFFS